MRVRQVNLAQFIFASSLYSTFKHFLLLWLWLHAAGSLKKISVRALIINIQNLFLHRHVCRHEVDTFTIFLNFKLFCTLWALLCISNKIADSTLSVRANRQPCLWWTVRIYNLLYSQNSLWCCCCCCWWLWWWWKNLSRTHWLSFAHFVDQSKHGTFVWNH